MAASCAAESLQIPGVARAIFPLPYKRWDPNTLAPPRLCFLWGGEAAAAAAPERPGGGRAKLNKVLTAGKQVLY